MQFLNIPELLWQIMKYIYQCYFATEYYLFHNHMQIYAAQIKLVNVNVIDFMFFLKK